MPLIYVTGGVRSGKSEFAERLAASQNQPVLYVAFGVNTDVEMQNRIDKHKARRPDDWGVVEKPYELVSTCEDYRKVEVVLVDCFSTWLTNRIFNIPEKELRKDIYKGSIMTEVSEWLLQVKEMSQTIIVVSSEVGLGGVAMSPLGRFFQDILGECNQKIAQTADEAYAVLSGLPVRIKL